MQGYTKNSLRVTRHVLPAVFAALCATASADVTNVSVQGTTSTQAVLRYTAPGSGACTVEVSESSSLSPLVHDVDAVLFAGANLDSRSESASNGNERAFVIGKRRAERAANGYWYSRALQAYTVHYYRITCGTDQATGSFSTTNIPLGNTYNDELPSAPGAGATNYFVNAGQYAWPDFVNWDAASGRAETVIDPHTGMLLKRITMPGDQVTGNRPAGDHTFGVASSLDGAWNNPANVLADDGASATFSGTGRNWLLMTDPGLDYNGYGLESLTFSVKGWCSGACAGDNAKIQACLTVNGVSCWPDQSNTIDVALGTSANPGSFAVAGSSLPIMAAWTPAGVSPLNVTDTRPRGGSVNVDSSGNVTYVGGDFFYPNWTAGSKFTIAGSVCAIRSVAHPKALTIDTSSCAPALSLPLSSAPYSAANFGVMVRKKTSSSDTIAMQFAKYNLTETNSPGWTASGSPQYCSDTATQNTVTGAMGYHCIMQGNEAYWIDRATADANYLGLWFYGSKGGPDGWSNDGCAAASVTLLGKGPLDPEQFYCLAGDNSGHSILLSCTLTSSNQPNDLGINCNNITPGSMGRDFFSLITQFTAAQTPAFDAVKFGGCSITGMQNGQLIVGCYRGYQDTIGWVVVFDPTKVDSSPGCVGSGKPGCVVAAQSSWATQPARWCTLHTIFMAGNSNTAWVLGKFLGDWEGMPGGGAHVSTVVSGTLTTQPSIAAGTAGCPAGSNGCDLVTVDGEPCNPNPAPSVGGHPAEGGTCPKNPSWEYLQDAQPGDVLLIPGNPQEYVVLVAKDGNSWLIQRGYGFTSVTTPSTPVKLEPRCSSRRFDYDSSSSGWTWDFLADPHGMNPNGATMRMTPDYAHPLPRPNLVVGTVNWVDHVGYGYAVTDGAGYGPPNKYVEIGPAFAGATGVTPYLESSQEHPSHPQDTAPSSEQRWFTDARPLSGPGPQLVDQAIKISGQLYKFTSVTMDGDNLTYIGGPNAATGGLNRKLQPTMAFCGAQPLIDLSSPAQGNSIADDASNAYQYCVARKAGECRSGSARGDIYVNCPYVMPRPDNTIGCDYGRSEASLANDICVYNTGAYLNAAIQLGYEHWDPNGALGRSLTKGLIRYRTVDVNENVHGLPDGSWLLLEANALQGSRMEVLAAKLPPYPEVDSIDRSTFIPLALNLTPPGALGIDNAVVQFGYAEYGQPDQFYCTSRHEACLAVAGNVTAANPFQFGSDGTNGTTSGISGVSCSEGCTIAIPALPQHVVYYQVLYRDSSNQVVAQTRTQIAPTP
ncbi:MAG TPA: hypothetical protein VMH28_06040 [Candidatus Acidoferrales bacterium]|nr:hypothetical protein [Candidatus Acidoferrales bacterium]